MSSSISSSDPRWRAAARGIALWAGGLLALAYAFVCIIDPWGVLPLSPPLPRVPISSNARFSFPALARSPRFDSVVLGTSTARLLRPEALDRLFGAHFANLAMNSATAWEQSRLLSVFAGTHPDARVVIIGLDKEWCGFTLERYTPRPFPEWMYEHSTWRGYLEMANLYAVQEAANQLAVMLGLKRRIYGLDGYTNFLPPEQDYDPARVDQAFARWGPPDTTPVSPLPMPPFPAHALLRQALAALPAGTRKVLFFAPYHVSQQGLPGSATAQLWAACKASVARVAMQTGAVLVDLMQPTPITRDRANYWDPLHYRVPVADQVMETLRHAADAP